MSDVSPPPPDQHLGPAGVSSWRAYLRQLWLGAVPVLAITFVIAVGNYGWNAYQVRNLKGRDRQMWLELQSVYTQLQDARENPSPDFAPVRARAQAVSASIPESLKLDARPGFPARQLLVWAARDDLSRLIEGDLSAICESEVEFVRKLIQTASWLDLPPPAIRTQPQRIAQALAEIEQLGGVVTSDPARPVQPVTAIEMKGDQFQDRHLEHLPDVSSLTIESATVTDAGLQHLGRLRSLATCRLTCPNITDTGAASLAELPVLREVHLYDCSRVTDNGLRQFQQVQRLGLLGPHITDQTLAVLNEFSRLEHLMLRTDSVSDEGIALLASSSALTKLVLSHCHNLSDDSLLRIAEIETLESLGIQGVDLTNVGLAAVGTLPRLGRLLILPCEDRMSRGLRITDTGLARMKNLAGLHALALQSCPRITDKSVPLLLGITSLRQLQLRETGITEQGHLQLVSSFSKARVDFVPTPPSPLEGELTTTAEGAASQDSLGAACQAWPVPDPQARPGGKSTVEELESEYRQGREATDAKYAGKWIELSGPVSHVGNNLEGDPIIRLRGSGRRFEIDCVLRSASDQKDIVEGEICHLRGVYCTSVIPAFIHCTVNRSAEVESTDADEQGPAGGESDRLRPDVTLTAEELNAEVDADFREAQRKYADKTLQVTGRVSRISHVVAGAMVYRLETALSTQCFLRAGSPWFCVRPGQTVTLVGKWFKSYPCLVDCEVIHVTGASDRTMAATALGEFLESDRVQFRKWFYLKQLIVTGEVIEKSAPEDYPDQVTITLRSTPETNVVCRMEIDELRATESVKVGDSVTITGWNTKETPTDAVALVGCLFWRGK